MQKITVAEIEKIISHPEMIVYLRLPADSLTFNEILKTDLHKLYMEIPRSIQQTVISCLYKKGDKEDNLTNQL